MSTSQIKAQANIKKNRLHLRIAGKVDAESLERLYTEIRFCVADLQPGFEVVNDISECQLIYITSLPIYKKIIDFLLSKRAREVVRIVGQTNLSSKQLLSFTDQINCYQPLYVHSSQEAEQRLEEIKPRGGIRLQLRHLTIAYDSSVGSGKAEIHDISITGCSVIKATLPLPLGMNFEGSISFPHKPPLIGHVQMKAQVVRCHDSGFAAKFLDLREDFQDQLYQRFLYEASKSSYTRS